MPCRHAIKLGDFFLGGFFVDGFVAPLDGKFVVGTDFWHKAGDAVSRLRDRIKPAVGHDGGHRAIYVGECRITQLFDAEAGGTAVVMAQAECVADFMRHHRTQQFAHHLVRYRQLVDARVSGTGLDEVLLLEQLQQIMPKNNVRGNHLSRARVINIGAHGIGNRHRHPADHRITRVLWIPQWIFFFGRCHFGDERIFEAGLFKCGIPVLDALQHRLAPFFRHLLRHIHHNRFDRLGNSGSGVFFLHAITGDEFARAGAAALAAVFDKRFGEITHTIIGETTAHGCFRQPRQAVMQYRRARRIACHQRHGWRHSHARLRHGE